jgi:hypothetical protein
MRPLLNKIDSLSQICQDSVSLRMQEKGVQHPLVDDAKRSIPRRMETAMPLSLIGALAPHSCSHLVDIGKLAAGL